MTSIRGRSGYMWLNMIRQGTIAYFPQNALQLGTGRAQVKPAGAQSMSRDDLPPHPYEMQMAGLLIVCAECRRSCIRLFHFCEVVT
jgi:hypothetical protein